MMWYDWLAICVIGLLWIEHYMDWKSRVTHEKRSQEYTGERKDG